MTSKAKTGLYQTIFIYLHFDKNTNRKFYSLCSHENDTLNQCVCSICLYFLFFRKKNINKFTKMQINI